MPKTRINMKKAAGEKRQEAQKKLEELKELMEKQVSGDLDEDSRLSAEEIRHRREEISDLQSEAKEIEEVVRLEDIGKRDDVDEKAREVLNETGQDGPSADEFKSGFEGIGEYLRAIRTVTGQYDSPMQLTSKQARRLNWYRRAASALERGEKIPTKELGDKELKTLVGDDTGSAGRGDFLVPTENMTELLRTMAEGQQFANRARRVPMARRTADFPRLAQTDASDTRPLFSFAAVSKIAEGAQKPEREPTFEQLTLTAIKYASYVEAGDELLLDSIVDLPPVLIELLTESIAYEFDRDTLRGSGRSCCRGR